VERFDTLDAAEAYLWRDYVADEMMTADPCVAGSE
jgi:hypothetical protein